MKLQHGVSSLLSHRDNLLESIEYSWCYQWMGCVEERVWYCSMQVAWMMSNSFHNRGNALISVLLCYRVLLSWFIRTCVRDDPHQTNSSSDARAVWMIVAAKYVTSLKESGNAWPHGRKRNLFDCPVELYRLTGIFLSHFLIYNTLIDILLPRVLVIVGRFNSWQVSTRNRVLIFFVFRE